MLNKGWLAAALVVAGLAAAVVWASMHRASPKHELAPPPPLAMTAPPAPQVTEAPAPPQTTPPPTEPQAELPPQTVTVDQAPAAPAPTVTPAPRPPAPIQPLRPALAARKPVPPQAGDLQGVHPAVPVARYALSFVGADAGAEAIWAGTINDPTVPAEARKDLIEDLNEDGFPDPKHVTAADLPLIMNRMDLIEQMAPAAMDDVNADAFAEAYKDLVNMMVKALR